MFQDRPSQQVQNCPSQQRTGPAVQVAIDKNYKRRIAVVDWRIIKNALDLSQNTKGIRLYRLIRYSSLILFSLSPPPPPPPNGRGAVTATMRNFRVENRLRRSKRRTPERPRPKVASLEEGENREHTRKDQAEPHRKKFIEAKDEDGRHHQHPKAPLVTRTEELKYTVSLIIQDKTTK